MKSVILDLHNKLKNKEVTASQLVEQAKALAEKNKVINSIITPVFPKEVPEFDENNLLSCIPYGLKDNYTTKGILTTGASGFLKNYIPPFSCTVYELFQKNGAILLAKENLDEYGLGGTGTHSAWGAVCNPVKHECITAGSSSGSVADVALGITTFSMGSDTGDSIRRPASFCGTVGYKPTYGAISRYGILPYAPSLDHCGILCKYVADACIVASYIFRCDYKDATSTYLITDVQLENLKKLNKIKFLVIKNFLKFHSPEKLEKFNQLLEKLKSLGHEIVYEDFNLDLLDSVMFTYRVISYVEGWSCYSNLTGIIFGQDYSKPEDNFERMLYANRTLGFGGELKRRFVIGAYLSDAKNFSQMSKVARQIRRLIILEELKLLKQCDCILMPTVHNTAPLKDQSDGSLYDDWLIISNFSGTPSITIPFTKINGMPWGLTLVCDVYKDMKLLNCAYTLECIIGGDNE